MSMPVGNSISGTCPSSTPWAGGPPTGTASPPITWPGRSLTSAGRRCSGKIIGRASITGSCCTRGIPPLLRHLRPRPGGPVRRGHHLRFQLPRPGRLGGAGLPLRPPGLLGTGPRLPCDRGGFEPRESNGLSRLFSLCPPGERARPAVL